ncbi:MAG: exodeoxyribonuclease V subunit alpha [Ferruginibacter sp.]
MQTDNDVHQQFAGFFKSNRLKPYAYLVSKRLAEGHICLNLTNINLLPEEVAYIEKYGLLEDTKQLAEEPLVSQPEQEKQPFILHQQKLYLQRYFAYESAIVEAISFLTTTENAERSHRMNLLQTHKPFINSLSAGAGLNDLNSSGTDWQLVAAILGILNNFTIITGGPGTGKTTTVAKILAILYTVQPNLKVALAAPTGKAAVRMAESLKSSRINIDASIKEKFQSLVPGTIHRLLKFIPGSPYFKHDRENPLVHDIVIVDEASMIDVALFAKLLSAIGPKTRIILLGDKDQLASVEAGSLLGDLCQTQNKMNSISVSTAAFINTLIPRTEEYITDEYITSGENALSEHIIELKKSHRFTEVGGIGIFSKAIINGRVKEIEAFIASNSNAEVLIDTQYSEGAFNEFIKGYENYINEKDTEAALEKLNQLRVLCAVREGPYGLDAVNRKIVEWLVSRKSINNTVEFYLNRPIIVTRNFPALNLYNGDVGIIRADNKGSLKAWFEDGNSNLKSVLPGYISSAETVFAMTIHKSQGSEYEKVLVMLPPNADQPLLTRELLYTAVTRAKKSVLLQASRESIVYTAGRSVQRASGIMERF